jgi:hypothetical protein
MVNLASATPAANDGLIVRESRRKSKVFLKQSRVKCDSALKMVAVKGSQRGAQGLSWLLVM